MALLPQIPTKPTQNIEWATQDTNNGENSTPNKVATTTAHKDYGWGYPEQPPRNIMNWWQNAVYKWLDYLSKYVDLRVRTVSDNFAYNVEDITGLQFTVLTGRLNTGNLVSTFSQTALTMTDNSTNYVYAYVNTNNVALIDVASAWPDGSPNHTYYPLYKVTTSGGAITDVEDFRKHTMPRKASVQDVIDGTDNTKFVTPYTLTQGFVVPSATTTVYGKVRLADNTDISNQSGDDVLTAAALATTQIRASNDGVTVKYGLVALAHNTDLSGANRGSNADRVLRIDNMDDANAYATTSLPGFVTRATQTDVDANEATKYVTPALMNTAILKAVPTGVVTIAAGGVVPTGWLECNGAVIANSGDTAALYAVIGTKYGAAGKLPDLRGEFVRGWDNSRGVDSGRVLGSNQSSSVQNHLHTQSNQNVDGSAQVSALASISATVESYPSDSSETRPRNIAMMYIIKK